MFRGSYLLRINIYKGAPVWLKYQCPRLFERIHVIPVEVRKRITYSTRKNNNLKTGIDRKDMSLQDNLLLRLIASSVKIADRAGVIVRDVMSAGNLKIVDKVRRICFRFECFYISLRCLLCLHLFA